MIYDREKLSTDPHKTSKLYAYTQTVPTPALFAPYFYNRIWLIFDQMLLTLIQTSKNPP